MDMNNSTEYFLQKKQYLKQCISLTEDFLSNIENWESLDEILKIRGNIIHQLENLEIKYDISAKNSCSESEKSQIDQLVSLLLGLSRDCSKLVKLNKDNVLNSIKVNSNERKLFNYNKQAAPIPGSRINFRKKIVI